MSARAAAGLWSHVWRRFRRSPVAVLSLLYIGLVAAIALAAPLLAGDAAVAGIRPPVRHSPDTIDLLHRLAPPSAGHPLGTDDLGRDVLARLIFGARVSLAVGLAASFIAVLIGSFFGAMAGYYGGAVDWLVSRLIEVVLCFPFLFLLLGVIALFRPSLLTIMIALGVTSWTNEARYMRGEFLRIRELEFAQAARASGARDPRIIFRHLLPNALGPVLVSASFGVASAILFESALSFLGLGVPVPTASWGGMLSLAETFLGHAWWLALFPGLAIFLTVVAFNIVGDQFREALDPTVGQ
jgi:peptide/nickel transport system permease protein